MVSKFTKLFHALKTDSPKFLVTKGFLFFLAVVAFIGIGSSEASAQSKFPRVVLQPGLWEKVEVSAPEECEGSVKVCSLRFLKAAEMVLGEKPVTSEYRLGERDGRNLTIVFVTYKVTDDDSITGVRYRLAVSLGDVEDRSYKLETLGRQFTCARGHKNWSKARCP